MDALRCEERGGFGDTGVGSEGEISKERPLQPRAPMYPALLEQMSGCWEIKSRMAWRTRKAALVTKRRTVDPEDPVAALLAEGVTAMWVLRTSRGKNS